VGIVFQSYNLFPHLTVRKNLTLGPRKVLGLPRRVAEHRADELLARVGLLDKADRYPDQLSGGQQQRVAIARSLAMGPQVLLLDEVTSALDPELVAEVLVLIRELALEGMTMMLATHEMAFARDVADKVVFLADGRIVESGPPSQVLDSPTHPRTQTFLARTLNRTVPPPSVLDGFGR
jgi:ABC-type polar amino acid transport system ATPase subunit